MITEGISTHQRQLLLGFGLLNLAVLIGLINPSILFLAGMPMVAQLLIGARKTPQWPIRWWISYLSIVILLQGFNLIYSTEHWFLSLLCGLLGVLLFRSDRQNECMITLLTCGAIEIQVMSLTGFEVLSPLLVVLLVIIMILACQLHYPPGAEKYTRFYLKNTLQLTLFIAMGLGLLVVFFPRIPAALLPHCNSSVGFGSGNRLQPGDISEMARSKRVVFHAVFPNGTPLMDRLYWRGTTLSLTSNGLIWYKGASASFKLLRVLGHSAFVQQIQLEPRTDGTLFALDIPSSLLIENSPKKFLITHSDQTFVMKNRVTQPIHYQAVSQDLITQSELSEEDRKIYLQVPHLEDPQFIALLQQLNAKNSTHSLSEEVIAKRTLAFFHLGGFHYELKPGIHTAQDLPDFLFRTRQGSCAHFAAAFATLMRVQGVPARIVLGFQGGDINPFDGRVTIRDQDAHAWVELWIANKQIWRRYDPTDVIAPTRIMFGAKRYGDIQNHVPKWLEILGLPSAVGEFVTYRSNDLWRHIPIKALQDMRVRFGILTIFYFVFGFTILLGGMRLIHPQKHPSPYEMLKKQFDQYCDLLSKAGILYTPSLGPLTYLAICQAQYPDLKPILNNFTNTYTLARYGPCESQLKIAVKNLNAQLGLLKRHLKKLSK